MLQPLHHLQAERAHPVWNLRCQQNLWNSSPFLRQRPPSLLLPARLPRCGLLPLLLLPVRHELLLRPMQRLPPSLSSDRGLRLHPFRQSPLLRGHAARVHCRVLSSQVQGQASLPYRLFHKRVRKDLPRRILHRLHRPFHTITRKVPRRSPRQFRLLRRTPRLLRRILPRTLRPQTPRRTLLPPSRALRRTLRPRIPRTLPYTPHPRTPRESPHILRSRRTLLRTPPRPVLHELLPAVQAHSS